MESSASDRWRVTVVALLIFFFFALVLFRFYVLQIIEGERWFKEAQGQHETVLIEPFKRGVFYSNPMGPFGHSESPQQLVIDVEKFHLYLDPFFIPDSCKDEMAQQIRTLLPGFDLNVEKIRAEFDKRSRSRRLAMWLDADLKKEILHWWSSYAKAKKIPRNAIYFTPDYQRSYPYGKLMGAVLHTIQDLKDETTHQAIPTGGLELQFNRYLQGHPGKRLIVHSPHKQLEMGRVIEAPVNGADVYLTINHYLQTIVEEELAKGVRKAKAKGGWAVMMDPYNGEIFALAQYPFFDPSQYRQFFNDPTLMEHTKVKAIIDAHEIGSIMKPLTLALCLKANEERKAQNLPPLFDPEEKMATSNGTFPGRKKPISDTTLHYYLNMTLALQRSSNIYPARMIDRVIKQMGADWYRSQLEEVFGLGKKTGIELPGEASGILPTPGKKHPNGTLEWSTPTPYSMAFGHNLLATSLQMVIAYATLANGGYIVTPTLVKKIVQTDSEGSKHILLNNENPQRIANFPKVFSQQIVQRIVSDMKYVTKPGGTATEADIPGYTEVGKTATAEKIVDGNYSKKKYFSSFVGFTPVDKPVFVLLIAIDEPEYGYIPGVGKAHHGGHCAAPIFSRLGRRLLEFLGVPQDDPFGYPVGDPRRDVNKADWLQEAAEMRRLYELWNSPKVTI